MVYITPAGSFPSASSGRQNQIDIKAPQPEVFGPGVLSDGEVFRGTFSPDGETFLFFKKTRTDPEEYRIYFSRRLTNGAWSVPERLNLGSDHSNTYPTVSPDGNRLVFASSRPAPGFTGKPNYYLWQVTRRGDGWGQPTFLKNLNVSDHYHSWAAFAADGRLHFRRTTPDWRTNTSLIAVFRNGEPDAAIPDPVVERCSAMAPSVRIVGGVPGPRPGLYFLDVAIPRQGETSAHSDIWVCEQAAGTWTKPRPLGAAINTSAFETFPFFSRDGQDLYFVRSFRTFYRMRLEDALQNTRTP